MAAAITLDGPPPAAPAAKPKLDRNGCRCVKNKRTGKPVKLCPVPPSSTHRSGWAFVKGSCTDD